MMWMGRHQWNFMGRDLPYSQTDVEYHEKPAGSLAFATVRNRSPYTRFSREGGGQLDGFEDGTAGRHSLTQCVEETAFKYRGFDPGVATDANYKFSFYRFTYRYRFYNGPTWRWKVGFTGFVRDARIALRQGGTLAEDTDVGFSPRFTSRSRPWSRYLIVKWGRSVPQGSPPRFLYTCATR